jgi:hypothetical protein
MTYHNSNGVPCLSKQSSGATHSPAGQRQSKTVKLALQGGCVAAAALRFTIVLWDLDLRLR